MLFYACPLPLSERKKLDTYLLLSENSNTWKYLNLEIEPGRSKIDQCLLFAAVLHCFVLGKASLREMEVACFTDLRIIYLIGEAQPSRSSFSRLIHILVSSRVPDSLLSVPGAVLYEGFYPFLVAIFVIGQTAVASIST